MPDLMPIFAAVAAINAITACMNITFLIINRYTLTITQRLAPLLLVSSSLQCLRALVLAVLGVSGTSLIIFNVGAVVSEIAGFTYFVGYILVLLKQAHVVVNQTLSERKIYALYLIHGVLALVAIGEIVFNNALHNNLFAAIKSCYYVLELTVILIAFLYSGVKLIRFANTNTKMMEQSGGESSTKASLSALKKSLYFLSGVCSLGLIVYFVTAVTTFRMREKFPADEFATAPLVLMILLVVINFFTTLHAWVYLDRCERKVGKDYRKTPKPASKKKQPTRQSIQQVPTKRDSSRDTSTTGGQKDSAMVIEMQHAEKHTAERPDKEREDSKPVEKEPLEKEGAEPVSVTVGLDQAEESRTH